MNIMRAMGQVWYPVELPIHLARTKADGLEMWRYHIHSTRYRYWYFEYCITDADSNTDTCELELITNDCLSTYTLDQKCTCISIKFYKILQNKCSQMVSGIVCIYTIDNDTDTLPLDTSISPIRYRYRHISTMDHVWTFRMNMQWVLFGEPSLVRNKAHAVLSEWSKASSWPQCFGLSVFLSLTWLCNTKSWQRVFCKYCKHIPYNNYQVLLLIFIKVIHPPKYSEI